MKLKWKRMVNENWDDLEVGYSQRQYDREMDEEPRLRKLKDFIEAKIQQISDKVWDYYVKEYGEKDGERIADKFSNKFLGVVDDKMIEWIENH